MKSHVSGNVGEIKRELNGLTLILWDFSISNFPPAISVPRWLAPLF
jgi:hypothetical protein